jgi:sn-glycerol 3-phosphate transport system substrate-binding protein
MTGRPAASLALSIAATAAQAQTEIQFWHSMGQALGDKVNRLAANFNKTPERLQVVPSYKGQYRIDDRRDRGFPDQQRAAHPAGIRGRHGDDDGRQGRDRAGGEGDEGRRALRSQGVPADGGGLLHNSKGNMLSFPFNSSTIVFYVSKDAFRRRASIPTRHRAPGGIQRRRRQAEGAGACVYGRMAVVDAHREFLGVAQRSIGTRENGMAGTDTVFHPGAPLHGNCLAVLGDLAKRGEFTYARREAGPGRGSSPAASARCSRRRRARRPTSPQREVRMVGELHPLP